MAVAVDSILTTDADNGPVTTLSITTFTVGSGANRAMVVALVTESGSSAVSVHWDTAGSNQALTLIGTSTAGLSSCVVYLYGLVAPTSGNKTLTATWTGSVDASLSVAAFTGADQTGGATTFAHVNTTPDGGTAASKAITSAVGNYTIAMWGQGGSHNWTTWNQTHWTATTGSLAIGSAGASATGAATVTYTATASATQLGFVGVDIVAAGGGAALPAGQNQLFPNPSKATPGSVSLLSWIDPLKLLLQGKDTFFAGPGSGPDYDYPNPRGPIPAIVLRTWLDQLKLTLRGQDRFFGVAGSPQHDWPNPVLPKGSVPQTWIDPYKLTLNAIVPAPFNLDDWPVPRAPAPVPLGSWLALSLNILSTQLSVDWTTSAGPVTTSTQVLPAVATVNPQTVIVVTCRLSGSVNVSSITDNTGRTWVRRARTGVAQTDVVEEWFTTTLIARNNMIITLHLSGTPSAGQVSAFGILGANLNAPFDTNPSLPAIAPFDASGGVGDPITISTDAGNTFCFGMFSLGATANPTAGAGFTPILGSGNYLTEYAVKVTAQTNLSIPITIGVSNADASIGDAIVAGGAMGAPIGEDLDFPNPGLAARPSISLLTWAEALKQNLQGQDRFFGLAGAPQFNWPNPGRVAPSLPPTWLDPLRLSLSFVIAPFGQGDWPVPSGARYPSDLRTFVNGLELQLQSQDQFFGLAGSPQFDWPVPKSAVPGISLRSWADPLKLELAGQDAFFGLAGNPQRDWPNPGKSAPPAQGWIDQFKLTLSFVIAPFGQGDWPNPRATTPAITLRSWLDPLKLELASQDAFFGLAGKPQNDWPNPLRSAPFLQTWIDPYKLALNGVPAPFVQGNWPNPNGPLYAVALRTWIDLFKGSGSDTFFGLAGNPQRDWPVPRAPGYTIGLRTWADPLKLELLSKDTFFGLAGAPQFDWPTAKAPARSISLWTWIEPLKSELQGRDTFFGLAGAPQFSWPNPTRPAPLHQAWADPFKYTLNAIPAPFVQGSWPNPAGPVYAVALKTWIDPFKATRTDTFFGLAGNPQHDWPNPRGRAPQVQDWRSATFHGAVMISRDPILVNW